MSYYDVVDTPLGPLFVGGSAEGLHRIDFLGPTGSGGDAVDQACEAALALLERACGERPAADAAAAAPACAQLREYFQGVRRRFDLPLAAHGTAFQRRVWTALEQIEFGRTAGYGDVARTIGRPGAARAVGGANHRNPLSIVVPCHRVVGAGGALTGYGGGLDRKAWLLEHEAQALRDG